MRFEKRVALLLSPMLCFTWLLYTIVFADHLCGVVVADCLNVRSGPAKSYAVVGQVHCGDVLNIEECTSGWAKINYHNLRGYVCEQYITKRDADEYSRGDGTRDSMLGERVLEYSKQFLGTKYVYGGTSPEGFDCSGLVYYCYKKFGVCVNRVAADQMKNGSPVSKDELLPGDLVFFHSKVGGSYVGHVGMYAGNGTMIHSPSTGNFVRYDSIVTGSYKSRYAGARRI